MFERKIDDLDGMYDDIKESFLNWNKIELVEFILERHYQDMDDDDLIEEFKWHCGGKIIE